MLARLLLLVLFLLAAPLQAQTVLVPAGSSWKYLDNGTNQGTAWRAPAFADSAWKSGAAQLGYGDGDEATVIGYGPNSASKYTTSYFRRSFQVADRTKFTSLRLNLLRDDGAVVYLNGVELTRSNMPTGARASTAISGSAETTYYTYTVPASLLLNGTNSIGVEIHQATANSSDVRFDLEVLGQP